MGTLNILTSPGFLVSIGAIFVVTVGALLFTQYLGRRHARRSGHLVDVKEAAATTTEPGVTFADMAGMEEAIAEIRELGDYLADSQRYKRLGAEPPSGILLHGPPGCGKTLLARALAGETGVPFYYISAASFVERYVGVGAARVRELFAQAREKPSILFIDELDAVGRHRHGDVGGGREFDNTLNQLLVELDGGTTSRTLVIAATNRPEMIDPALLRPGRFDRRVLIDLPGPRARQEILALHAAKRRFSKRVDWARVANDTAGCSAADLANLVNEASLLAARHYREMIGPEDVDEACSRLHAGTGAAPTMDEDERLLIAYHEAGHALLCLLLRGVRPPPRVSIFSRGRGTERSIWSIAEGRSVLTKRELQAQLILLLGGRAAEMNAFGEPTTRSEDDLQHAATLARRMVEQWAMIARADPGGTSLDTLAQQVASGLVGASADPIGNLLNRAEQAARVILADHAASLELIAETLAERETLTAAELEALVPGQPSRREPVSPRRLQALPVEAASSAS